ncbi:hypothetical protein DPMN_032794 [Dreissena polymorpha]|uniref:Uncharacterized protein n=1 Tax=Dreissena polymorpha TaxID=45954 RepID=A0A9D4RKL1_DREPO|nr:hypothetical protein DPMN_032794 [Dreissena polymorpha]
MNTTAGQSTSQLQVNQPHNCRSINLTTAGQSTSQLQVNQPHNCRSINLTTAGQSTSNCRCIGTSLWENRA